ncbi:UPF0182 family protein [Clostridium akagii]|uniref:UPF0182 family protein n=1 Tax=Clostridium akagii TaxID=91623 RepID=UPI00047E5099|nr:UPF0182 family protein [Clostridium akagii]
MKKKVALITSVLVIILVIIFANSIVNFIINIEWYKEVGYLSVYFIKLIAVIKFMVPIFVVCFVAIWFYYKNMRKSIVRYKKIMKVNLKRDKIERKIFTIFDIVVSFTVAYSVSTAYWYKILQFQNSVSFNTKDPIFNRDISFYVFKLPLIESIYGIIMSLLILLVVITVVMYFVLYVSDTFMSGNNISRNASFLKFNDIKNGITKFAGRQLAILFAMIFLLLSFGYLIKGWELVYSDRGVAFGASYTDVHVSLVFFRILAVVCIIASVAIFTSVIKSKVKPIIISVAVIVALIIIEGVVSVLVQNVVVKSNEKALESPYIKYNIDFTRKAYNVDAVDTKEYPVSDSLTENDIQGNMDTINNIKLNSYKPSLEFYNQTQVFRYYYNFKDVDVDRYNIDGKLTEVFVSPREIEQSSLAASANTWQNKHLNYTHGYGLVMSKVNSITSEGQPDFVMNNIPVNNKSGVKLENPRIYFGENTDDYAIVNNKSGEFDYPESGSDKTYNYNGKAGIKASLANRLLFAINQKDLNFLVSNSITSESKILINRNIVDRVKKIAPFLQYDKDPYSVVDNGKLYWVIDAYTTSDRYPFSEPQDNINYIRNSVKVVVDAFDGGVNFYQMDKNDPIANSYNKIFKGIFKDVNSAPIGIRQHFRYPEDLFDTQSQILQKYHVTDPGVFYNSEDLWSVAENQKQVEGDKSTNPSTYVIMKLPNEKKEETILMEYFNANTKENMVSILGARMDGNNYGKLVLYKLPTDKTIYSPYMFKQKINQNPDISKEISLWNTQGSQVQFGDTSILPINNSLLYVDPVYIRAQGKNSIPEVKKVIVASGTNMVMADNMGAALQQLFNYNGNATVSDNSSSNVKASVPTMDASKIKEVNDLYNKALDAQKNGDWSKYGDYIKQLGDKLQQLQK